MHVNEIESWRFDKINKLSLSRQFELLTEAPSVVF